MTPTARDYQQEIDKWARHNFEYIDRIGYGPIEEIGEYIRAHMKFRQKIRNGAGKTEGERIAKLHEDLKDALADAMIFTLHLAEANGVSLSFGEAEDFCHSWSDWTEITVLATYLRHCANILELSELADEDSEADEYRVQCQGLLNNLFLLCQIHHWEPLAVLEHTWKEVSQRDWVKFPKNGLTE